MKYSSLAGNQQSKTEEVQLTAEVKADKSLKPKRKLIIQETILIIITNRYPIRRPTRLLQAITNQIKFIQQPIAHKICARLKILQQKALSKFIL